MHHGPVGPTGVALHFIREGDIPDDKNAVNVPAPFANEFALVTLNDVGPASAGKRPGQRLNLHLQKYRLPG
jgi:hypothetical protein